MVERGTDWTLAAVGALIVALVISAFFWPVDPNALNSPQALLSVYQGIYQGIAAPV